MSVETTPDQHRPSSALLNPESKVLDFLGIGILLIAIVGTLIWGLPFLISMAVIGTFVALATIVFMTGG